MITIQEFVKCLGVENQLLTDDTYLIFCGNGLIARCFTSGGKIVVMLAGSEWVIENVLDVTRTCEDIHTFIGNR